MHAKPSLKLKINRNSGLYRNYTHCDAEVEHDIVVAYLVRSKKTNGCAILI